MWIRALAQISCCIRSSQVAGRLQEVQACLLQAGCFLLSLHAHDCMLLRIYKVLRR